MASAKDSGAFLYPGSRGVVGFGIIGIIGERAVTLGGGPATALSHLSTDTGTPLGCPFVRFGDLALRVSPTPFLHCSRVRAAEQTRS